MNILRRKFCWEAVNIFKQVKTLQKYFVTKNPLDPSIGSFDDLKMSKFEKLSLSDQSLNTSIILYTSGTTSRPKGSEFNGDRLIKGATTYTLKYDYTSDDIVLFNANLSHVAAFTLFLIPMTMIGGSLILMNPRLADEIPEFIQRFNPTRFLGVPITYHQIVYSKTPDSFKNPNLKTYMVTGDYTRPEISDKFREIFGINLTQNWGMSEVGIAISTDLKSETPRGSCGKPLDDVECKICRREKNFERCRIYGAFSRCDIYQ